MQLSLIKMRWLGTLLGTFVIFASSVACYNDSDTYLTELRDHLDLTNAIIGRFTLYPPEYYKRRIEIQTEIIKKDPNNLTAYDNISVAYDRIGEGGKALKWITEKRKYLANANNDQLYSTEANEGTFLIVRWIRGHKPGDVTDAVEAEKHIVKALQINPNAHFGREFAQLYCIRAMIVCSNQADWTSSFTRTLTLIADKDHIDRRKLRYGIAGMMVLGAAWNMPVLIQAMADLVPEDGQFAGLCKAKLRFMVKGNEEFMGQDLTVQYPILAKSTIHGRDSSLIYDLLGNGSEYQKSQQEWIVNQVANGRHPDSGDDIWRGYHEVPPIPKEKIASSTIVSRTGTFVFNWALQTMGCCCIVPGAIILLLIRDYRKRKLWK